jgi:hypothetical protein
MKSTAKRLAARAILTAISLMVMVSPLLADWNATHIYNPRWPPHAKFHNAQTMAMAVLLGLSALFFTWRRDDSRGSAFLAAWIFAALYWVSQALAFLFPGVAWTDPDLLKAGHSLSEFPLQLKGDLVLFALLGVAGWLVASANSDRQSSKAIL